jgi:hypothetical protein
MQLDLREPVQIIDCCSEDSDQSNPMKKLVKACLKKKLEQEI